MRDLQVRCPAPPRQQLPGLLMPLCPLLSIRHNPRCYVTGTLAIITVAEGDRHDRWVKPRHGDVNRSNSADFPPRPCSSSVSNTPDLVCLYLFPISCSAGCPHQRHHNSSEASCWGRVRGEHPRPSEGLACHCEPTASTRGPLDECYSTG